MAKLVQPPPKFTHPEWNISNQMKYANAEGERAAAERLADESKRLCDETDKTMTRVQRDVDKKFEQRLFDMEYWNKEVDDKLNDIKVETDNLLAYRTRIDKAIEACREPLHISQQCLLNRQRRQGIDLVHDDPEKELLKEVEVIQGALALLIRTREQADEQIRLNRKAKYNLEKDLKDKADALAVDKYTAEMKISTAGPMKRGAAKIQANSSSPDEWEDFSNDNILDAEKQRQNSEALRSLMDGILQSTSHDMLKQKEIVDIALDRRIAETRDSKEKLEGHLSKVVKQLQEMEDSLGNLKKAVADKSASYNLSNARLESRSQRPGIELCRDPVQYRLVEQVSIIETDVGRLQERFAHTEASIKGLIRRQLELEEEIAIKTNSLLIDETECVPMRKSISIQVY